MHAFEAPSTSAQERERGNEDESDDLDIPHDRGIWMGKVAMSTGRFRDMEDALATWPVGRPS